MEIIKVNPQGFCKGVIRAIAIINKALKNNDIKKPIYIIGFLFFYFFYRISREHTINIH